MATPAFCGKCGAPLAIAAAQGLCPACLLKDGLDLIETAESPSSVSSESTGTLIGRYKLLQRLGEGGMGTVWMAEQLEPVRRRVALKVVKLGMDTKQVIARFEAERQALALMDHPNIAKVLDAGASETGRPYFVMELVRGIRMTDYCDAHQLSARARLDLFVQVCQAVQHAHQKGIIHRDIKPSNILVTQHDGVPVPKIIDFGIAKATTNQPLTNKTLFTAFEQFVGTPAYMSPEQAEMSGLDIDSRSDIYTLGVLLYELLTGKTPFDAERLFSAGLDEIRRIIREEDPVRPSARLTSLTHEELTTVAKNRQAEAPKLVHLVRGDLDWIVMKALEKDRARRYPSASALAEDIQRHLADRPVEAYPPSMAYRTRRFVRRNRVLAGSMMSIASILVMGVIVSLRFALVAVRERNNVRQAKTAETLQRQRAETNAQQRNEQVVRLNVANGLRAMENDDRFGALLWFIEALRQEQSGSQAETRHRLRIGAFLNYIPRLIQVWTHDAAVNTASFSSDGRRVLTASRDRTARVWDALTGEPIAVLRHDTNVSQAVFSADLSRVVTSSDDGKVRVWNPVSWELMFPPLEPGYPLTRVLISPDGRRLFTAGDPSKTNLNNRVQAERFKADRAGELRIWDATTGHQVRGPFFQKGQPISDIALSPDGKWLAAIIGGQVMVWNLQQPEAIHLAGETEGEVSRLAGKTPEEPGGDREGLLPDIPAIRKSSLTQQTFSVVRLAFRPDSQGLLTARADGGSEIWQLPSGKPIVLQRQRGRRSAADQYPGVQSAAFSPDGERVILVDGNNVVRLWNARSGEGEGEIKAKASRQTFFSPDGALAVLSAQAWDMFDDLGVSPRPLHWDLRAAAFSPDGARLLTAGGDGAVRLWSLAGALPPQPPFKHDWPSIFANRAARPTREPITVKQHFRQTLLSAFSDLRDAVFSTDGRRVLTASGNGTARLWDTATGRPLIPFVNLDAMIECIAFSPDETRFITAGGNPPEAEEGLARVWDARTGEPLTPVLKCPQRLESAAFSPDGNWLVTHSRDDAQIWNARTGQPAELPMKLEAAIRYVAFSRTSNLVAVCVSSSGHRSAGTNDPSRPALVGMTRYETRLWNVQTGRPVTSPLQEGNEITHMEFSPDGRWLITFVRDPKTDSWAGDQRSGSVRFWTVADGKPLPSPPAGVVFFRPTVNFIASSCAFLPHSLSVDPVCWDLAQGHAVTSSEWLGLARDPDAVSADGQRVAAIDFEKREALVYDALTGERLAPPLRQDGDMFSGALRFSSDGGLLLAQAGDRAQLWPLPVEKRLVEDLVLLTELLSGRRINASGDFAARTAAETRQAWQMLRGKYPDSFAVKPEQVRVWRERIVALAEKDKRWFTADFHLDHLTKEFPDDETLQRKRARVRNQMEDH